jgi:hypothetical protein
MSMKKASMRYEHAGWLLFVLLAFAVPAMAQDDPCQGKALCENPGPFVTEIVQASPSMHGNNHHIRVVVRVRNTGAEPLVLGYVQNSGVMEDELGNRYIVDRRYRKHVSGIGQVTRNQADAQFVLAPGAARNFTLVYQRYTGRSPQIARSYSPALTLARLQPLSQTQVRTESEYSLNFFGMGLGGAQAADALGRGLRRLLDGSKR